MEKIVVLNGARINYDGEACYSALGGDVVVYDATGPDEVLSRVADACVVVTKEMPLPGSLIRRFPSSVRLICEAGTGYNNIDLAAAQEKGIAVCNVPAYSTQRVAHTVLLLMLCLASSMHQQIAMLARGDRRNFTDHLMVPHMELNGKTLGVVGAGSIGREVIKLGRALGMSILVHTRTPRPDEEGVRYTTLEEVLQSSDYLSLHCPLTEATRHLIDRDAISRMKPGAFLINTARGALVDEPALIEALQSGRIAGAGLDVQETEPPVENSPLYTLPNVVLTPHMGWKGLETRRRLVSIVAENIRAFLEGHPQNLVS